MAPPVDTADTTPSTQRPTETGPRASLWTLRVVALIAAVLVVAQPILAGEYLSGAVDAIGVHGFNANFVILMVMVQIAVGLVYFLAGRGRLWPALFSGALFFLVGIQIGMGYSRDLAVHIPLGVMIVASQVFFTIWVFRRAARYARPRKRRQA
ncbi:hypothetical protein [Actinopolymorpha alba]|uniref:hypothetical protein n=1 Tax=Actinopolymorpha alba TaxID=533267 RepID=UPI0003A1814D|nr:hypothetical protein [Actinopolymorpha alba]